MRLLQCLVVTDKSFNFPSRLMCFNPFAKVSLRRRGLATVAADVSPTAESELLSMSSQSGPCDVVCDVAW
jgi:hypothetical protein